MRHQDAGARRERLDDLAGDRDQLKLPWLLGLVLKHTSRAVVISAAALLGFDVSIDGVSDRLVRAHGKSVSIWNSRRAHTASAPPG